MGHKQKLKLSHCLEAVSALLFDPRGRLVGRQEGGRNGKPTAQPATVFAGERTHNNA